MLITGNTTIAAIGCYLNLPNQKSQAGATCQQCHQGPKFFLSSLPFLACGSSLLGLSFAVPPNIKSAFQWGGKEKGKEAKGILLVKSAFLFRKELCLWELVPTSYYTMTSCQVDQKLSHFSGVLCCPQQNSSSVSREKWKKQILDSLLAVHATLVKWEIKKTDILKNQTPCKFKISLLSNPWI